MQRGMASVSTEFRTALQPHGRWQQHPRFGEVWIPADRRRDWRPYTVGRWLFTEDWGWYWVADREEADWGWITYHYGRWINDDDLGWAWLPGDEWGPGFVQWRHGREHVGWAPLPPDEIVVEYRERPEVWVFVGVRDFVAAPRLAAVIVPIREQTVLLRETFVVNQTVILRDRGRFAVNPGIPATVIAAAVGQSIRAFDVRPRILAGTAQIPGAIEVRAQDLRGGRLPGATTIRETRTTIQPSASVPQLQPLRPGEPGRLGDNPPRAAQRAAGQQPPTIGQAPGVQPQQPPTTGQAPRVQPQQPPTTGQAPRVQPQQQPQTTGQAPRVQPQQPPTTGQAPRVQPQQQPPTTGQAPRVQPQQQPPTTGQAPPRAAAAATADDGTGPARAAAAAASAAPTANNSAAVGRWWD
jgi:hypothetical protein